eukprot:1094366-Heterocapsa_arctica.AAC.1
MKTKSVKSIRNHRTGSARCVAVTIVSNQRAKTHTRYRLPSLSNSVPTPAVRSTARRCMTRA